MTAPSHHDRITALELEVRALMADRTDTRRTLRAWTIAIVVAMVGAVATLTGTGFAVSVAYGELRERAATNERLLSEVRQELVEIRRDMRERAQNEN